ncbi:hypothetical protein EW146_g3685 [Bondarzewia mesenterica]|uniref:RING-type domain-containing protein n=1 Tax=Bondarzewia mesenterica TaxID=1095465 RepID=A0A4S4LZ10_9AGAM|nr:hypothetical protein EW146_g3685 [Bondarzewia mesenterica]
MASRVCSETAIRTPEKALDVSRLCTAKGIRNKPKADEAQGEMGRRFSTGTSRRQMLRDILKSSARHAFDSHRDKAEAGRGGMWAAKPLSEYAHPRALFSLRRLRQRVWPAKYASFHPLRSAVLPLSTRLTIKQSPPLGHILCRDCCTTIIEKNSPRLPAVCPFCREEFTQPSIRLIRIDFSATHLLSGASTPRRSPLSPRTPLIIEDDFPPDLALKASATALFPQDEARRLESKVAKLAAKKCSVDEVTALHKELQDWLASDAGNADPVSAASASRPSRVLIAPSSLRPKKSSSLYLSALLLHAILANHHAFQDATKAAKAAENTLKEKVNALEIEKGKLEVELLKCVPRRPPRLFHQPDIVSLLHHRQKAQSQKVQDAPQTPQRAADLGGRYKSTTPTASHQGPSTPTPMSRAQSLSPPSTRVSSPTNMSTHFLPSLTRLTFSTHAHTRSASVAPGATSSTHARATPLTRSPSVAPTTLSTSVASPTRAPSTAPRPPLRSATPHVPFSSQHHPLRSATPHIPSPVPTRSTIPTPTPTPTPRKTRTLSNPSMPDHRLWYPAQAAPQPVVSSRHTPTQASTVAAAGRPMGPRTAAGTRS